MLEAAVKDYNWGYFDGWPDDINVRTFWLFMLWRIKQHGSENKLIEEFKIAFPDFVLEMQNKSDYLTPEEHLASIIASRFVRRFLEFWGFAVQASDRLFKSPGDIAQVNVLPLFDQVFQFNFDE
ncbi:hypothetical protein [Thiomicrorhabdus aquaedulcis]|uniref:hypothetical protein n=1 Tax=Thiomicrorhabdus aquaedulcis TaxID=2211106 RepID=UPI001E3A62EC|nr:hypothetical protein [Thiomicrorhabdus aquaedulcis]